MTPNKFKQMRELLGLSQKDLAEKLGKTPPTICNYENGKRPIDETIELSLEALLQRKKEELNNYRHSE